jgi:hypothetical protein
LPAEARLRTLVSDTARLRIAVATGTIALAGFIYGAASSDWWFFGGTLAVFLSQLLVIRALRR